MGKLLCFSQSGIYPVAKAPRNRCIIHDGADSFVNSLGCIVLSTNNYNKQVSGIRIYPNPTYNNIEIVANLQFNDPTTITIYNVLGEKVYRLEQADLNMGVTVNTKLWTTGVFMLVIQNNAGILKTEKISVCQ